MKRPLRSEKISRVCEMHYHTKYFAITITHFDEDVPQEHQTNAKRTKKHRNKQEKQRKRQKNRLLPVGVEPTLSASTQKRCEQQLFQILL